MPDSEIIETPRCRTQDRWATLPDSTEVKLVHLGFGTVLGPDRKPPKTRSGTNFTLKDLLNEAIERGTREVQARSQDPELPTHDMTEAELEAIGRAVGIGAIKYADLGSGQGDYLFDLDRMISFEGDTGPYIQYAPPGSVRCSPRPASTRTVPSGSNPEEPRLALELLKFSAPFRMPPDSSNQAGSAGTSTGLPVNSAASTRPAPYCGRMTTKPAAAD